MGNYCGKRAWQGTEEYYRDPFAKQAEEQSREQAEKEAEEAKIIQEENEAALRAAEAEAARRAKFEADTSMLINQMITRGELISAVDATQRLDEAISKQENKISGLEKELAELTSARAKDAEAVPASIDDLKNKIIALEQHLSRISNLEQRKTELEQGCASFVTHDELKTVMLAAEDEAQLLRGRVGTLEDRLQEMHSDMENQAEGTENDYKEVKMLQQSLEGELQTVLATLGTIHQRVTDLECADAAADAAVSEADGYEGASCCSSAVTSIAGSKSGLGFKVRPPRMNTVPEPGENSRPEPAGSDSDSSEAEEVIIPYTTGKLGINTVELIDWGKLLTVQKKKRVRLTEIDKLTVRQLLSPPLRSKITSWKRWKEQMYHWIHDLRRVRVGWTDMGAQVLSQSFTGMEGEYAVAESASTTRDIIAIMKAVDLKFATPTRGMIEKLEEWVPLITRDDGQEPMLFLHLLGMVFAGEKRIGVQRSEHSKVNRALSAMRLHGDKEMVVRSQLPANIEIMDYQQLEHVMDALKVQDAARYDTTGKKHEKKRVGEPNYLNDLLTLLGDRRGRGDNAHHTALNNYFNSDGTGAGESAEGHAFATTGTGVPPGKTSSAPATPRGGAPGGRPKTEAERHEEDKVFWKNRDKIGEDQKKKMLEERMASLKRQHDAADYWCPLGDWCGALRTAGFCKGQHQKAEYGRGMRRLQRDNPTKYKLVQEEKRKYAEEKKKKEKTAKAGGAS
eukprot:g17962.t1